MRSLPLPIALPIHQETAHEPPADLFFDALDLADTAITYRLGQRLAELKGARWIEVRLARFDLDELADDGRCTVAVRAAPYAQTPWYWNAGEQRHRPLAVNAWLDVEWEGTALEVVRVASSATGWPRTSFVWAEDRARAEAFVEAVCAHATRVRPEREILVYESGGFRKDKRLSESIKRTTYGDLVLRPGLKEEIRADVVAHFEGKDLHARYGVPWRRGLLFSGPPGNGKTHAVKALVNDLDRPCLYVRSFVSTCSDELSNIRAVFERARELAPCATILEDVDSLVTDRTRSVFLNELDGFSDNAGLLVVATTNHPERLDPAITHRPSRFDRRYTFGPPALAERRAYLERWTRALEPDLRPSSDTLELVAERTGGFSFAYLKELVVASAMRWLRARDDADRSSTIDAIVRAEAESLAQQIGRAPGFGARGGAT